MSDLSPADSSKKAPATRVVGVLSDTHGLLRPEAIRAFEGVDLIIHAGDVGSEEVIRALEKIAPVKAVRGNVDKGEWARRLPTTETVEVGRALIYVVHDRTALDLDPRVGFKAVISGHSHRPSATMREGVLYLNPGSAGPRRFKLPVSVARLYVRGESLEARLIELEPVG